MVFFAMIASLLPGDRAGIKLQRARNGDNRFVCARRAAEAAQPALHGAGSWQFRHRSKKIDATGYREASSRLAWDARPSS
jgi:hypothetical protein